MPALPPALIAALLLAAFAIALGPAWQDPGLFGDDLKWRVGSFTYHPNLEREGRWLTYAWNAMLGPLPGAMALRACLALWVLACVTVAEALAGPRRVPAMALLALALAANPAALSLLMWPLTSLPGFLLLAAMAVAVRLAPQRPPWLAAVAAGGGLLLALAHQLLALAAVAGAALIVLGLAAREGEAWPRRALPRLVALAGGAAAGLLAGTLAGLALNAWMFGRFGLAEDPWRLALLGPDRPRGLAALTPALAYHLREWDAALQGLALPLCAAAAALCLACLRASGAWLLALAAAAMLGATLALPLATGIPLPELRGTLLLWQGLALLAAAPLLLPAPLPGPLRSMAMALLAALPLVALPPAASDLARFSRMEAHNRQEMAAMLQRVAAEAQARAEPVEALLLLGHPGRFQGLPGRVEYFWWIYFLARAESVPLFGRPLSTRYCPLADCPGAEIPPGLEPGGPVFPEPGSVALREGLAAIRLGP
ncbi:MAG: hypothetical protein RMK64_08085 [Rhodovarius sp.]|nr:hypothetical protein [Rhodovarius sp.]